MRQKLWGLMAGLVLMLLGAGTAHAAVNCGANTGVPATGTPIIIGAITGQTGPDDFSSATKSAKAYFACVNANGGIHGRPVKYLVEDDQWNPELATQLANKLVNDDKAIAMVGNSSFVECGANAGLYQKAGIAVLAGVGVPRECFFSANYVPLNAGPRISTVSAAMYAIDHFGAKNLVCIGPNIPGVGDWECNGVKDLAAKRGVKVNVIILNTGSADFTSIILQAESYKPDAIILGLPKGLTIPVLQAADDQGLAGQVPFLSAASAYDASVPAALGADWNGNFYSSMEFNDAASPLPDNQNWLAVMQQYGKPTDPRDTFSQGGYLAAEIATKVLLGLPADGITRANFLAGVSGLKSFNSDILCAPWYFDESATHHNPNHDTRMSVVSGTGWKVVSACTASQDPELADILAAESKKGL